MTEIKDGELDRATDSEYAAVSTAAVIGLVLSILGLTAFWAVPLVAAPAVGLAISIAALRKIRRAGGVLVGRWIAIAGIVIASTTTVTAAGYHARAWLREHQTLRDLGARACAITDAMQADRYDVVYRQLPEDFRRRQAKGVEDFRKRFAPLFEGAGPMKDRKLVTLQLIHSEEGPAVAPATVEVTLERRALDLTVWFRQKTDGTWEFVGVGGGETIESATKFHPDREPAFVPGPYEFSHEDDHEH